MRVNKSRYPRQSRQASLVLPSASDRDTIREAKAQLEAHGLSGAPRWSPPLPSPRVRRERMRDLLGPELWARARFVR
jgi:hypothetical protein